MNTLRVSIPSCEGAQALDIEAGIQNTVAIPYPPGFGYRDAMIFGAVDIEWSAMAPVPHHLRCRRQVVAVTTAMKCIDGELRACAVFILGGLIGESAETMEGES